MKPTAVIFDFYGTLAQDEPGHTLEDRIAPYGLAWDYDVERTHSNDGDELGPETAASRDAYEAFRRPGRVAMLEMMGVEPKDVERVYAEMYDRVVPRMVYPDTRPAIDELKAAGLRLAICSNWDWDLDLVLEQCGLTAAFEVAVTSARVGCRKPHPRIFEHTLDELGLGVDEAVYVGDTVHADVDGPLAIGLRPIHIWRWYPRPRPALPDGVAAIDELTEVLPLLASS